MSDWSFLETQLRELDAAGLRRDPEGGSRSVERDFASNDYLGFARLPAVLAPRGAGASRLIAGNHPEGRALERRIADWLGLEDALAFSSGHAANAGLLPALIARDDFVVSDALNHASIIDGLRLSRATVEIVAHADVAAIERALSHRAGRRAWVVVESYYSMDADGHDPRALAAVCDGADARLIVDEAHAFGVLGDNGKGRYLSAGVTPDVVIGTLSKAFGSQGGFVAGARVLREWLWNRARSFVFSTGLAPVLAASAKDSLERMIAEPQRRRRVLDLAEALRAGLRAIAGDAVLGFGHIVPVVVGGEADVLRVEGSLRARGLGVVAIRPPTVPVGSARLRFTVNAALDDEAVALAAEGFREAWSARKS